MQDVRVLFLSKELRDVINYMVGLSQQLLAGLKKTPCYYCRESFKNYHPFIFIVLKDLVNIKNDTLKLCCLKCCRRNSAVMDVIELYPTLKLHDVKKLMYYGVIKKFFFDFVDTTKLFYKKYAMIDGFDLGRVFEEKSDNVEIQQWKMVCDDRVVAEDSVHSLRVEYGREFCFDTPLEVNSKLMTAIKHHSNMAKYYLEVYYKEYEPYKPFMVTFNQDNRSECAYCVGKVYSEKAHPILYCSLCGPTNPNYFSRCFKMMLPFWTGKYDYNKIYWRISKKHQVSCSLMLYAVDTRRVFD
ncbi:ME53 [Phthorimaea operculella granulovirus]|uniref:ME53 n=1 Tax=Phthorimaea operculella granulovirus TaxID=192584 RepID=Q8JRS9_9BBAC|nr:ME53 [Phthorimaea operculella granulovirus]AAM70328.1 ME53 [Phthorimaea operculella granulovirus]ANY57519.1 ME53 [Phthorimaea operculella granulovirus]QBH65965.1 ME53 [Phthorimaea operculella granulovirus]QBH66095.1 ME53 [Phthorimaea operculella granulovirus]QBH66225.1 ME53 [Phthorimaea operculella granulovirus]